MNPGRVKQILIHFGAISLLLHLVDAMASGQCHVAHVCMG